MFMLSRISRFQAFGAHLLVSLCLAGVLASIVFLLWYSGDIAYASGVGSIFVLLIGVDVILGPVITLIIFNPLKKELKRDLGVVVTVQMAALLLGMYSLFVARPVYIVFNADRFDLVYASDIGEVDLIAAGVDTRWGLPMFGPEIVSAKLPADPVLAQQLVQEAVMTGEDIQYKPQYYLAYSDQLQAVKRQVRSLANLEASNPAQAEAVAALIDEYKSERIGYIPLIARDHNVIALIDKSSAEVIAINSLRP